MQDITDAKSCHTGEKRSAFKNIHFARSGGKAFHLLDFEIVDFRILPFDAVEIVVDVLFQPTLLIRYFSAERGM